MASELVPKVICHLDEQGELDFDGSPWVTWNESSDLYEVDFKRLFPTNAPSIDRETRLPDDEEWLYEPSVELLGGIERALHDGRPDRSENDTSMVAWDTCAWYQPIHFFGYDWGIYIREDCLVRAAIRIARFIDCRSAVAINPRILSKPLLRAAFCVYFLHEQYHHKIECFGLRVHVASQNPVYSRYSKHVYRLLSGTDDQIEEALANADSYRRLTDDPYNRWLTKPIIEATREFLRFEFPVSPPGYR